MTFCITLTLCVCYNSLNLLQFEFSYFQPYLILAIVIGVICSAISDNYNTIYSGVFGAVFVSELIRSKNVMFDIQNNFSLGDVQFSTIILVSIVSFLISLFFVKVVKKLKHKFSNSKQEKQQNV